MTPQRRAFIAGLAAAPATLVAPPVHAETRIRWRMATSWPKNLPGPGIAAAHIARRVGELSGGRFEIQLFGAGEIVPALQVLDAVGNGTVEMGHSAAFYWVGKMPASVFFTSVPFGAGPVEHQAWIERGGGQAAAVADAEAPGPPLQHAGDGARGEPRPGVAPAGQH